MKRTVFAAVALVALTAVSGAAMVPGQASTDDKAQTRHFVLRELKSHNIGGTNEAGTDVIRHQGEVVGYTAVTSHFYPKQQRAVILVAFALKGGIISARVNVTAATPDQYNGRILNGTGKYKGIDGNVQAHSEEGSGKTFVTLKYVL